MIQKSTTRDSTSWYANPRVQLDYIGLRVLLFFFLRNADVTCTLRKTRAYERE